MSPVARTRACTVEVDGLALSGLIAEPDGPPRALLVALHGHAMTARYFAGTADPALSLLELGAAIGFTVWAPDRIGYGATAAADPALFAMFPQADLLGRAIDRFAEGRDVGAGCVMIGHSFGFKLALAIAAAPPATALLGIDGSGTGVDYSVRPQDWPPPPVPGDVNPSWGPSRLYPVETFSREHRPVAPIAPPPAAEGDEWPDDFRRTIGPRVTIPVRFTIGEHDRIWPATADHFDAIRAALPAAPLVDCAVQRDAGHNVSLAHAGRAYHLKALAFAEECLLRSP